MDVVGRITKLSKHPTIAKARAVVVALVGLLSKVPEKWRRWIAASVSVALHALALLFLLEPQPTGLSGNGVRGEGVGEGEGFEIDLVSTAEQRNLAMTAKEVEVENIEEMEISTPPETAQLVESDFAPSEAKVEDLVTNKSLPALQQTASSVAAAASAGGQGQGESHSDDGLWDAIAPCWHRLADKYTLPVRMTVSFGSNGMLSASPVFERKKDTTVTNQTERSETLAVMALAECGSYQMAIGKQAVAIDFPAASEDRP
jgi:hypothetical protein